MERAIDPLLTIDAKLWADEFMATKQRLGDAEFDHAMMLGWFANAIMRGYDAGRDSMTHTPPHPDAQATIAALQAMNNRLGVRVETLESQLTQRTAELEAAQREACLQREVEAALSSKVAEYEVELNGDPQNFYGRGRTVGLRTLILALPKVEGEIEVVGTTVRWGYGHSSCMDTRVEAEAYAALLQERQKLC